MPLISQLKDICRSSETSEGQFKVVPTFFPIDSFNFKRIKQKAIQSHNSTLVELDYTMNA